MFKQVYCLTDFAVLGRLGSLMQTLQPYVLARALQPNQHWLYVPSSNTNRIKLVRAEGEVVLTKAVTTGS